MGLAAGAGALARHVFAQEPAPGPEEAKIIIDIPIPAPSEAPPTPPAPASTGYAASPIHRAYPLEFRIDDGFRPDLSDQAARSLVTAVLQFLESEHAGGMTMTFWGLHPSKMPFLPKHLEAIVEQLFRGIAENLTTRAVDPILVLALLYNESRFHPTVVSPAGAVGMAQFMPDTARDYGLQPTARPELWSAYREARAVHRQGRDERIKSFRSRHGEIAFAADAAIDRAIASGSLDVLTEYRGIRDLKDPSADALKTYMKTIEADFAKLDYFGTGREALEALDARTGYRAVAETVRYLARTLETYHGLATTAIASYNAGLEAVRARDARSILHRYGELPTITETVRYVQRILATHAAIKLRLYGLEGSTNAEA